MTKEEKNNKLQKVLNYWFEINFLDQGSIVSARKSQNSKGNDPMNDFVQLEENRMSESLEDIVSKEAIKFDRKIWGNLTVYLGKISREKCIEYIRTFLPDSSEKAPEKNTDNIFCASLQLSPTGMYVKGSLSLSPILWSISQLSHSNGNFSDVIDEKLYQKDKEQLEQKFFVPEHTDDSVCDISEGRLSSEEVLLKFSQSAVTLENIQDLMNYIEKNYIKNSPKLGNQELCLEKKYRVDFQLFKDEASCREKEEDNYYGLSNNYFLDDLRLILENEKNGSLESSYMGKDLENYILALCLQPENERMDLLRTPDKKDYDRYLLKIINILDANNSPLGKWPSRHMPAFMQQVAINLSIGKTNESKGKIFSINGPPGSGKTSLIREIVANNIVERAVLLSEYEIPDDAFEAHKLSGNSPSQYLTSWYSLKNDRINDYSILVASSNNTAVENISKELPIINFKDLSPLTEDLFDPERSGTTEFKKINKQSFSYKDLYFTKYAQDLFSDKSFSEDQNGNNQSCLQNESGSKIWGLISAPLGKPSNIEPFRKKVLDQFTFDNNSNQTIDDRLEKYKIARKQFLDQLKIVKQFQRQYHDLSDLLKRKIDCKEKVEMVKEKRESQAAIHNRGIKNAQERIQKLKKSQVSIQEASQKYQKEAESVQDKIDSLNHSIEVENQEKERCLNEIKEQKHSLHWWVLLFNNSKYKEGENKVEGLKSEIEKIEIKISDLSQEIVSSEERKRTIIDKLSSNEKNMDEIAVDIKQQEAVVQSHKSQQIEEADDCSKAEQIYNKACVEYKNAIQKVYKNKEGECTILDIDFLEKLFSEKEDEETKIQLSNPWFTENYNREREKLFALALRLNKEFVLSTKCCRNNFKLLSAYWRRLDDSNKRFVFSEKDKDSVLPALFQTLFLLVPVISTTFASVGIMFKDMKKSGTIGMLIVDEAGQAQPQEALGALFRCRRAVIIGDPKQIEPVVTEDEDLLRKTFSDDVLAPYTSKALSVQNFADRLNCYGAYLGYKTDQEEWVGCPLLIHRRCISPMFDISNSISYNGIMKQKTIPPEGEEKWGLTYPQSMWFNVHGQERGNGNHFVEAQGEKVCEILDRAFLRQKEPDIFIISPFKTVVAGIISYIQHDKRLRGHWPYLHDSDRIGTVHTFQGREANEVIFLLGCDKYSLGAVQWVNTNIVNVAVTRAKYRLYIIGDENVWSHSDCIKKAKTIMDNYNSQTGNFLDI